MHSLYLKTFKIHYVGLEGRLSGSECLPLLHKTRVLYPVPTLGIKQMSVTPASGEPMHPSGLLWHLTYVHILKHRHIHVNKNNVSKNVLKYTVCIVCYVYMFVQEHMETRVWCQVSFWGGHFTEPGVFGSPRIAGQLAPIVPRVCSYSTGVTDVHHSAGF